VLRASWREHEDRDWRAVVIGRDRPLKASSLDGTLIRVPDTPANRAMFGSLGTADDTAPYPLVRALPLNDASTRGLLGMLHGPAGTDKAAAEQKVLDAALEQYPHVFAPNRVWLMDRLYHGAPRIARLIRRTHVLIRLKSDIPLRRISPVLADGSYLAELSGDGVTVTVRVIEYWVTVEGQDVPEMFCLVTDPMDIEEYPAAELAALYKWRWDGSETALREAKASLDGAGPSAGPMLRFRQPGTRAPGTRRMGRRCRDDPRYRPRRRARRNAGAERPPRRPAGPAPRDLSRQDPPRRDRRDPRREHQLHHADQGTREIPHRHRPAPAPQDQVRQRLPPRRHHHPHRRSRHHHGQQPSLTSASRDSTALINACRPVEPAVSRHDTPALSMPATGTTHRNQNREPRTDTQCLNPVALGGGAGSISRRRRLLMCP
jgi:hypothetical protein